MILHETAMSSQQREMSLLLYNGGLRLHAFSPDRVKHGKVQNVLRGLSMERQLKKALTKH